MPPPGSPSSSEAAPRGAAVLLSAVAGWADTAGFLALFGLFTAHTTGNLVTAGAGLASVRGDAGAGAKLVMIPVFMASVALTGAVARARRRAGRPVLGTLLLLEAAGLAAFLVLGVALRSEFRAPAAWAVVLTGAAGVVGLGVQNALMREALGGLAPTTVMTGNLTGVTLDAVAWATERGDARAAARTRLLRGVRALGGFVVGAALGAALTRAVGLASIGAPLVAVLGLGLWTLRQERQRPG